MPVLEKLFILIALQSKTVIIKIVILVDIPVNGRRWLRTRNVVDDLLFGEVETDKAKLCDPLIEELARSV